MSGTERMRAYRKQREARFKVLLDGLRAGGCTWCGEAWDGANILLPHMYGDKRFKLTLNQWSRPWEVLVEEASKAEVMCRGCHKELRRGTLDIPEGMKWSKLDVDRGVETVGDGG